LIVIVPYVLEIHHVTGYPKPANFKENAYRWLMRWVRFKFLKPEFEDACTYPCLAAQGTEPTKARINASGVVTWHVSFPAYPVSSTLGFRAIPGDPTLLSAEQVAFSGINSMGDTAGSDKIYRIGGVIETIPLSLGFTQLRANGINDSGVVVGLGKIGTTFRAFIYTP
jgi:hypothetical protein